MRTRRARTHVIVTGIGLAAVLWFPPRLSGQTSLSHEIHERIEAHDLVFNSGDFSQLAEFYDPEATIFQDTTLFSGYHDYRDRYLDPELGRVRPIRLTHAPLHVHVLGDPGRLAYMAANFTLVTGTGQTARRVSGVETLILSRNAEGAWKIRHAHITRAAAISGPE